MTNKELKEFINRHFEGMIDKIYDLDLRDETIRNLIDTLESDIEYLALDLDYIYGERK